MTSGFFLAFAMLKRALNRDPKICRPFSSLLTEVNDTLWAPRAVAVGQICLGASPSDRNFLCIRWAFQDKAPRVCVSSSVESISRLPMRHVRRRN